MKPWGTISRNDWTDSGVVSGGPGAGSGVASHE